MLAGTMGSVRRTERRCPIGLCARPYRCAAARPNDRPRLSAGSACLNPTNSRCAPPAGANRRRGLCGGKRRNRRKSIRSAAPRICRRDLDAATRLQRRGTARETHAARFLRGMVGPCPRSHPLAGMRRSRRKHGDSARDRSAPPRTRNRRLPLARHHRFREGHVADVIRIATDRPDENGSEFLHPEFREALLTVAGMKGAINSRSLGNWLAKYAGKVVDGVRFDQSGLRHKVALWQLSKLSW